MWQDISCRPWKCSLRAPRRAADDDPEHCEKLYLHSVARRAQPDRYVRPARRFMDASEFHSHHDQRSGLAERAPADSGQYSSVSAGSPSFEAANQPRSFTRFFRTGIKSPAILPAPPERSRRTLARLSPWKWNLGGVPTRSCLDFLSLNGGGSLAGAGYFSGKYAPFDVTPAAERHRESCKSRRTGVLHEPLQHAASLPMPHFVGTPSPFGSKLEEMADFYSSGRNIMYDTAVTNAFRFGADDQQKYGNNAFGNACVTARNVMSSDTRRAIHSDHAWRLGQSSEHLCAPNGGIYRSGAAIRCWIGESDCRPLGNAWQWWKNPARRDVNRRQR